MNERIEDERGGPGAADDSGPRVSVPRWVATAAVTALLVAVGVGVYANSFAGVLLPDDYPALVDNPHVRHAWPTTRWHWTRRPVTNISLSVNYAVGGLNVRGYHVVNVALHVLASLALFGVVRRTLRLPRPAGRLGAAATPLAAATALIWLVHPLHTGAVTYVIQRSEVLMGLFFLLTLYCAVRAFTAGRPGGWVAAALLSAAAGAASKEVMVVAPLVILLYDAAFVEGTFRGALKRRWKLHAALAAATWVPTALLVWSGGAGAADLSPGRYAFTQLAVVGRYLGLAFWPAGQSIDHALPDAFGPWRIVTAAGVAVLLGLTVWAAWSKKAWGFVGAWVFLILAPTSSLVPLRDAMAEHRMYLPLAGLAAGLVVGAYCLARRVAPWAKWPLAPAGLALAGVLATLTVMRNNLYRDEVAMCRDIVAANDANAWAHWRLGLACAPDEDGKDGDAKKALTHLKRAAELDPDDPNVRRSLGSLLRTTGDKDEAVRHYREAARLKPRDAAARIALGKLLIEAKKPQEATEAFREAVQIAPDDTEARLALGSLLAAAGDDEALGHLERALELNDRLADAYFHIALLRKREGKRDEAVERLKKALAIDPGHVLSLRELATKARADGKEAEAIGYYRRILAAADHPGSANNLAWVLATSPDPDVRDGAEAVKLAERACRATHEQNLHFLDTLGVAYAETGQFRVAVTTIQQAIDLAFEKRDGPAARALQSRLDLFRQGKPYRRKFGE